jgi:hypothetical protein
MDNLRSKAPGTMNKPDRYQKVAGEYYGLAKAASSPYLRDYFQRTAELYRLRAQGELRVSGRESISTAAVAGHGDTCGAAASTRPCEVTSFPAPTMTFL